MFLITIRGKWQRREGTRCGLLRYRRVGLIEGCWFKVHDTAKKEERRKSVMKMRENASKDYPVRTVAQRRRQFLSSTRRASRRFKTEGGGGKRHRSADLR